MATADELFDQATAAKEAGDLVTAVARLEEALQVSPGHVLSHSALAVYLQKLGRKDEAIQHATRVTELEPNDPFSFTQLSVICQRCGKIPEAEDAMARSRMLSGGHHH